ncbi:MAG TPA: ATP-grasp domain-containing protein [Anaerolineales bacterium]|nr:ATP-grasp domain-containing protein [Anaerolineales bacterium]
MSRLILLASAASYRAGDFEKAAKRLGIDIVLGMDVPAPLAHTYHCDLPLDYLDVEKSARAIATYAESNPVGAILSADDSATVLAARASQRLGLRHNSPEAAEAARDKYTMRQFFERAGIPSPKFRLYSLNSDPEDVVDDLGTLINTDETQINADRFDSINQRKSASNPRNQRSDPNSPLAYPVVLKPRRLSGSRGVIRADDPIQFMAAYNRLRPILEKTGADDFLVEEFIPGVEVALEGMLDNGVLKVLALFDKPDPLDGPYFEETIYVTPSRLPETTQQAIIDCAARAAAALGLRNGPVHAELRVNESGPVMVELAGRSIGGLCSRTLQFGTEMSLEELILRQTFGLEIESAQREGQAGGVMMIPIPRGGTFLGCDGVEEAKAVPGIESIEITAKVNYPILPLPEGESYLGFIFARGTTPEEVEAVLRESHRQLRFEIVLEITVLPVR